MVQGKPYVHWKITNERMSTNIDYNYIWATVVESTKGPINTPVLCSNNQQVIRLFGVDLGGYFAQGAENLIVVRASAESKEHTLRPAEYDIKLGEDFVYKIAVPEVYETGENAGKCKFIGDDDVFVVYPDTITPYVCDEDGTVKTEVTKYNFTSYAGSDATAEEYGVGVAELTGVTDELYSEVEVLVNEFDDSFVGRKFFILTSANANGSTKYQLYEDAGTTGTGLYVTITEQEGEPVRYTGTTPVKQLIAEDKTIPAGTALVKLQAKFKGAYQIKLVLYENILYSGYNITLSEDGVGYVNMTNVLNLNSIVNIINDKDLNVYATLTEDGAKVMDIVKSSPIADIESATEGSLIAPSLEEATYTFTLREEDTYLQNGSNGEWEDGRIAQAFQAQAHAEALESLRNVPVTGVFCVYGEDVIQREYVLHGEDPNNPAIGMNSDEVCKWRTILLGANEEDRESVGSLIAKAKALNNQYILFLGQGLIVDGVYYPPFIATQFIAGLRARLFYANSIFGGQSSKSIRPINSSIVIAPLFAYQEAVVWQPDIYTELNEAGVLTFTNEYGNLSVTDGVTTSQLAEEDEEAVINILKFAQKGVHDICVNYIGRNINADLQSSLEMEISAFLETMTSDDQALVAVEADNLKAYEVEVFMNSRSTQLVGKIFVYLKITPVHALRQVEVSMTVQ